MEKRVAGFMVRSALIVVAVYFLTGVVFISGAHTAENMVTVRLETSMGNIVLALDREKAPETVANFMQYVDEGFYESTIFHRIIGGFMIQGGGFDENMNQKATRNPIQNEAGNGLSNEAYTVAMARTQHPDSATAQFYINLEDNPNLDRTSRNPGYTVFGKVTEGKDVVDAIGNVKTRTAGFHQNVPVESVVINKVSKVDKYTNGDNGSRK